MSVELKVFGGAYFPKDKALKKTPELKSLAISVNALNKGIAEAVIFGKLAAVFPEHIDDYFKVKIWEHREGLPCPTPDDFCSDFFTTFATWNVNAGEPEFTAQPEGDENKTQSDDRAAEEMKSVRLLDQHSRAACLALFGPLEQITAAQYGQVVDLVNDDASSFTRELAEALSKETRALEFAPERQEQLLAWVRENAKESSQWPDIKKLIAKWIDTPADKRPQATSTSNDDRTDSGTKLRTGAPTDRNFKHSKESLGNEIALGMLAREHEFNIYSVPGPLYRQAETIRLSGTDEEFDAWYRMFISTPGGLDFSRAINIAVVKTAPENIWKDHVKHREYFNRVMTESDHANPAPLIVDIACGRSSSPMPNAITKNPIHDETQPAVPGETDLPVNDPGRTTQLDKELNDAFEKREALEQTQQTGDQLRVENLGGGVYSIDALTTLTPSNEGEKQEVPPALSDREIEIAHALNDLLSGRTRQLSVDEAADDMSISECSISDLVVLLMDDVAVTECCLSPDLDDEEIHLAAAVILDEWSDDKFIRQKSALDAIVEYRKPAPAAKPSSAPINTIQPSNDAEPEQLTAPAVCTLNYRQQLILAAMQGMCANPSYRCDFDDLPAMAIELADGVINQDGI